MKRGDIYMASLDPTAGHEQQGHRPLLVVSNDDFNAVTWLPIIVPITSGGQFVRRTGYAVSLTGAGLRTSGVVRCEQPRPVDLLTRKARFIERLSGPVLDEVLDRVADLFT